MNTTATATSLRERAAQALREDEGRAQQRVIDQANLRLMRLQDTLMSLLSQRLDVHVDDRSELHEIAVGSAMLPAYKVDDLTFTLTLRPDGYALTLLTYCRECSEVNRWTVESLASLQRTLNGGPCWQQHGETVETV